MEKARLEAFSDGVFAIVITLLILDIRIPDVDYAHLSSALVIVLPRIIAYVISFFIIGVYWISHHNSMAPIQKVDRGFLWLNILLLLCVSFIPFPTSLLGRYPYKALPIMIYGANLILCNGIGFMMLLYVKKHPEFLVKNFRPDIFRKQIPVYMLVNSLYLLGIILAPFYPIVSYVIYTLVVFGLITLVHKWLDRKII